MAHMKCARPGIDASTLANSIKTPTLIRTVLHRVGAKYRRFKIGDFLYAPTFAVVVVFTDRERDKT